MITDQIGDLLTRIRNAQRVGHYSVEIPASRTKERILQVLVDEGYVAGFEKKEEPGNKAIFTVALRYTDLGLPVIKEIQRVSKPGRRVFVGHDDIPKLKGGLGTIVVSTSKGMLTDREARRQKVGGELVCSVF